MKELKGIGGWLLLLVIKLGVGGLVRVLAGISEDNHALGALNVAFGLLAGAAAYLLVSHNLKGLLVAKIFLAADATYYLLAVVNAVLSNTDPVKPGGYFAASLLYFLYLFKSERVKNTYFPQLVLAEEPGQEDIAS